MKVLENLGFQQMKNDESRLKELVLSAKETIYKFLEKSKKPVVAFSGGKDGYVATHIAYNLGINYQVCETSFTFKKQRDHIKEIGKKLNFNIHYKNSLSWDWLKKNRKIIFSNDTKLRGWSFAQRHQKTIHKFMKENDCDGVITGRRNDENSVKAPIYVNKHGLSCHPLYNWKEKDIWDYFAKEKLEIPYIYSTDFGKSEGNAPFYTLREKDIGSIEKCWEICLKIDNSIPRKYLES